MSPFLGQINALGKTNEYHSMAAGRCEEQCEKKMQEMKFLHAEKTELLENSLLKASFLLKKITAAKYPSSNEFLLQ